STPLPSLIQSIASPAAGPGLLHSYCRLFLTLSSGDEDYLKQREGANSFDESDNDE
ncbi:hypothetical protein E2562_026729, partial [Oryza meyeriana var. granulata]